jgi:hypothetical protein
MKTRRKRKMEIKIAIDEKVLGVLERIAGSLEKIANEAPAPTPEPKKKATKKADLAPVVLVEDTQVEEPAPAPVVEEKVVNFEDLRSKLTTLSREGKSAQVKSLIQSYGVSMLSELPQEKYGEILEKAEGL